ncbi:hypothetical protein AHAS_Ahas02G0073800 [Arachis hypogaea]
MFLVEGFLLCSKLASLVVMLCMELQTACTMLREDTELSSSIALLVSKISTCSILKGYSVEVFCYEFLA